MLKDAIIRSARDYQRDQRQKVEARQLPTDASAEDRMGVAIAALRAAEAGQPERLARICRRWAGVEKAEDPASQVWGPAELHLEASAELTPKTGVNDVNTLTDAGRAPLCQR